MRKKIYKTSRNIGLLGATVFLFCTSAFSQTIVNLASDGTLNYDGSGIATITNNGSTFMVGSFPILYNNINLSPLISPVTVNITGGNSSLANTNDYQIIGTDGISINATSGFIPIQNAYSMGSIQVSNGVTFSSTSVGSVPLIENNGGSISSIQNLGSLTIDGNNVINNMSSSSIDSISNQGTLAAQNSGFAIYNLGSITNLNNSLGGVISTTQTDGASWAFSIRNSGTIDTFSNSGTVSATVTVNADAYAITNDASKTISTLNNTGIISATSINYAGAINNSGTISSLTNSGSITAETTNSSSSYQATGILNFGGASIGTLTNTGTIQWIANSGGSGYDINNAGLISYFYNAQGAGNSAGAISFNGNLPNNYGIILGTNSSTYGKLAVTNAAAWDGATGTTNFSIYSGSVKSTKYTAVISGVTASLLTTSSLTGTYASGGKSYAYTLALESGSSDTWDLLFPTYTPYPSTADTQQSLVNTASALQGTFALQNAVLANSFAYDCTEFGANNVCISAGGRNTAVSAANGLNNTSALLIAAYRPHPNYRIGAYADQNLSVRNSGSTVTLGNNTPLVGIFGVWSERLDGTGTEVKVSAAYGQKNTTVTRSVVGTSEAGSGSSQLNSQGAQVIAKYGFGIVDNVIVSPYVGMRYTQNNMNGYSEQTTSSVTAPLTYSALNTNATTALAGVGASYKVVPTVTTFASAGLESNTNTNNGSYYGTNSNISGLTAVNFNANPVKNRATATLGAYYDIEKNQRLGITGIYRQEAYQAVQTTTVLATYTVGL